MNGHQMRKARYPAITAGMTEPTSTQDLFKGRHFDQEIIILCVRWYLAFKLSSRDLALRMGEREILGGSSRFLGLRSRAEIRIPAPESVLPLIVEHAGSYLQEEMRTALAPSHLLFLHHSLAHDLIDRRLDETGSDPFPVAIALPVVRYELLVALDVGV